MNNLSYDIWMNISLYSPASRSSAVGFSSIGSICSPNRYSIIEYLGFNNIQNAAHELGHRLDFTRFSSF